MATSMDWGNDEFKKFNVLERHRIESFQDWPYDENVPCSITKMAEAGFYWTGNQRENDTATCFVCRKTLDGWEADDDPWKEHKKHAPQCEFVKYGVAEKDLTVEQFLKITGVVVKNQMRADVNRAKLRLEKESQKEMDAFLKK